MDAPTLSRLLEEMKASPRDIMRTTEAVYQELGLNQKNLTDEELIQLMVQHPDLIQRPILEMGDRAVLGRPVILMAEFLDEIL